MSDIIERLNKRLKEVSSNPNEKREIFIESLKKNNENARIARERHNEYVDMLYKSRVDYVKERLIVKRRIFRNNVYIGVIEGSNPLDDTALVFFGMMITQKYKREWDHYPTDEEIYKFVCDIYGEPKYDYPTKTTYTLNSDIENSMDDGQH